ncbi:formimidoylglutamate deiminase [Rhizobium alvei]|uniref:Formimidoylglutamate deiminase n=1 Tax=Rhizobium alvei TaxID=1132659 RepID=A0ABT8YK09_9HYPH|nr:formimidoylglutamate deiminase [Rhizobium alvei]MDO6963580.1 formimidoylglutamate deiminase [Rhizobium alvei]
MPIFAKQVLTPEGWRNDVRIEIAGGRILSLTPDTQPEPGDERHAILIAGMPNLHSHAFQRAMAGLTERPSAGNDNFWSWRDVMYRFTFAFEPEDIEAVAAFLYVEMLESGFTRVGEFHYLHHDRDGRAYANIAELGSRIASASTETGIALTLLPVFYAHSNFGGLPPADGQRRFVNDLDSYARLLDASRTLVSALPGSVVGIAPHSLRAATGDEIRALLSMSPEGPVHIHAAEQVKEIEDSIAYSGRRPVEWLLDEAGADGRWCFIHATHMTDAETIAMAKRGVVAGLCPVTEANLGDGFFAAGTFIDAGGAFGIGTDSNVLIGVADELRQLEYSQRLLHRARNVLSRDGRTTGRSIFERAVAGGGRALGSTSAIAAGMPADFVSLRLVFDLGFEGDTVLDSFLFGRGMAVDCVWVHGLKQVDGGRHVRREAIETRYQQAMQAMLSRI